MYMDPAVPELVCLCMNWLNMQDVTTSNVLINVTNTFTHSHISQHCFSDARLENVKKNVNSLSIRTSNDPGEWVDRQKLR
jgi:hypothetical protein